MRYRCMHCTYCSRAGETMLMSHSRRMHPESLPPPGHGWVWPDTYLPTHYVVHDDCAHIVEDYGWQPCRTTRGMPPKRGRLAPIPLTPRPRVIEAEYRRIWARLHDPDMNEDSDDAYTLGQRDDRQLRMWLGAPAPIFGEFPCEDSPK